jgi:hypothetical protein
MEAIYSFYPFLHLRLFPCMLSSLLSLFLSHVTNMVVYIASSSFFSLFLNNTLLLDVSRCLRSAIEIEIIARRMKHNSISYGQFA